MNPTTTGTPPAASAALAAAEARAATGTAAARLGYQLTTEALKKSEAATVFPLLLLELTAISDSFTAYAATDAAWQVAQRAAQVDAISAAARRRSPR